MTTVTFLRQNWAQFCYHLCRVSFKTVFSLLLFGTVLYFDLYCVLCFYCMAYCILLFNFFLIFVP